MITNDRLELEKSVLERKLPSNAYKFMDIGTDKPYLVIAAKTNRGNIYTLRIELDQFPAEIPKAFINKMLKNKTGGMMNGISAAMHTLTSEGGRTRICHYGYDSWNPNVSLYKVYVKCRLWLEMYELHLDNGKPIDYYLNHQD